MTFDRRWARIGVLAVTLTASSSLLVAQDLAVVARPALTSEQVEDFLMNGRITQTSAAGKGITDSRRATISHGGITHEVHIQTVDDAKLIFEGTRGRELNFKDSYRFNIAAYRLARLLGLTSVPMSVERRVDGHTAAVTWWVDDVMMDEGERRKKQAWGPDRSRTAGQIHIMRVFDELIYNTDRNAGNLLWTTDWNMWMIDHTRAFRLNKKLAAPKFLERCERGLLEKMRTLTLEVLTRELGTTVTKDEAEALLARRDEIVKLFEGMIAQRGEGAILYTFRQP